MENTTPAIDDLSDLVLDKQMRFRIDKLTRDVAVLQGRRDAMNTREAEVTLKVAEAKGRKSMKDEIEGALEALQKMAHERSVGSFERMLTAITYDVLHDERMKIKLDLTTERSMPALNISACVSGNDEDITSGALANIASLGLRFITLARSGRSRFILLDESDCFVENGNVDNFFNVVDQLSRDAGIQAVVITHHDISAFEDRFRIYKINEIDSEDAWPRRTPELMSKGRMEAAPFQDQHFSFIEAQNFENYTRARIELSPGVTAITGKNFAGKSSWARMLRSAFLGESSDSNIRHGQTMTGVNIGFSDGRVLTHNRRTKGTPKGEFIMHTAESYDYACENPSTWKKDEFAPRPLHHTETARLPEWVTTESGVGPVDGINVALWNQLNPVFMLDEPASKRASLLSVGRESGHLFAMNEIYKDDLRTDNLNIREGEVEISSIRKTQELMKPLDDLAISVDSLTQDFHALVEEAESLKKGIEIYEHLVTANEEMKYMNRWLDAVGSMESEPAIERTEGLIAWLERVDAATQAVAQKTDAQIPDVPQLESTQDIVSLLQGLEEATASAALLGKMPSMPMLPEIENTEAIARLHRDMVQATLDSGIERIEMPDAPALLDTHELEQILQGMEAAKQACALPHLTMPVAPVVERCDELVTWLDDYSRVQGMLTGCKAQNDLLISESRDLDRMIDRATAVIGSNFTLPGDRIERLAEQLVYSTHGQGSEKRVLCVLEEIQHKLSTVAREGYAYGLTEGLEQSGATLQKSDAPAKQALSVA